jgi:hypothetical protein
MKDRRATVYAKVLFFSTWPFKNEFEPWVCEVIRALRYLRFAGVAQLDQFGPSRSSTIRANSMEKSVDS